MQIRSSFQKASWWYLALLGLSLSSIITLLILSQRELAVQREFLTKQEAIDAQVEAADKAQEAYWSRLDYTSTGAKSLTAYSKTLHATRNALWQENEVHVHRGLRCLFGAELLLFIMIGVNVTKSLKDRSLLSKISRHRGLPAHP